MEFFSGEQGKTPFSRNSSGVNLHSSGVDPYFLEVFRGECNFMEFFKGKKKSEVLKQGYGYQLQSPILTTSL